MSLYEAPIFHGLRAFHAKTSERPLKASSAKLLSNPIADAISGIINQHIAAQNAKNNRAKK